MTPRRFLKNGFVFLTITATLVVAVVPVSPEKPFTQATAHAQETPPVNEDPNAIEEIVVIAAPTPTPPSSQDKPGVLTQALDAAKKAGAFVFDTGVDALLIVVLGIASIFLNLASLWTYLGGTLLNGAIFLTVVHMGTIVNEIPAITIAWEVVRDLANILIIFVMVWISIATILRIEQYGAKKLLASVIIAAVLLNFSLFITKAIIDVSNRFSVEIVSAMGLKCTDFENGECWNTGVSARFASVMKLTTAADIDVANLDRGKMVLATIMGIIVLLVAGYIFFAAAVLLVTRFVVLIILMVLSPIGFVGTLLPRLKKSADKWWETLINQSLFAPFYLLLLYISLIIVESPGFQRVLGGGDFGKALSESTLGSFSAPAVVVIINYMVVIGFLVAALMMAKSLGAYGADTMLKWGKSLAAGAGAWAFRPVGWASHMAGIGYNRLQAALPSAEFDPRKRGFWHLSNLGLAGLQGLRRAATFGVGGDQAIRSGLKAGAEAKFFGKPGYTEYRKEEKARERELASIGKEGRALNKLRDAEKNLDRKFTYNPSAKKLSDMTEEEIAALTPEERDALAQQELVNKIWEEMTPEQRAKYKDGMTAENMYNEAITNAKRNITRDKVWDAMDESERARFDNNKANMSTQDIQRLAVVKGVSADADEIKSEETARTARKNYGKQKGKAEEALQDLPKGALKRINDERPDFLRRMAPHLSAQQFNALMDDEDVTEGLKTEMRQARFRRVNEQLEAAKAGGYDKRTELPTRNKGETDAQYEERLREYGDDIDRAYNFDQAATALYNMGRYELKDESDYIDLVKHSDEDLFTNEVFVAGLSSGKYTALQKSNELATNRREQLKGTRRAPVSKMVKEGNRLFAKHKEAEARAEAPNATDADRQAARSAKEEFDAQVEKFRGWFGGKTTEEALNELADEHISSPLFAAAAPDGVLTGAARGRDKRFTKVMAENMVAVEDHLSESTKKQLDDPSSDMAGVLGTAFERARKKQSGQSVSDTPTTPAEKKQAKAEDASSALARVVGSDRERRRGVAEKIAPVQKKIQKGESLTLEERKILGEAVSELDQDIAAEEQKSREYLAQLEADPDADLAELVTARARIDEVSQQRKQWAEAEGALKEYDSIETPPLSPQEQTTELLGGPPPERGTAAYAERVAQLDVILDKMRPSEVANLPIDQLEDPALAEALDQTQFDMLMKSDLPPETRRKIIANAAYNKKLKRDSGGNLLT